MAVKQSRPGGMDPALDRFACRCPGPFGTWRRRSGSPGPRPRGLARAETWMSIRENAGGLPAIILSGDDDETLALQAIQEGAQEYLTKSSCTPELLMRTLRHTAVR